MPSIISVCTSNEVPDSDVQAAVCRNPDVFVLKLQFSPAPRQNRTSSADAKNKKDSPLRTTIAHLSIGGQVLIEWIAKLADWVEGACDVVSLFCDD